MSEGMKLAKGNPDAWFQFAKEWKSAAVGAAEGLLTLSLAAACARGVDQQQPETTADGVLDFFVLSPDQEKQLIDSLNINGIALEDGRVLKPVDVFQVSEIYPVEGSIDGENYNGVIVTQLDLDPASNDELVELYTFTKDQTPVGTMWAWWETNENGEADALKLGIGSDGIAKIQVDQGGNPIIVGRAKIENGQVIRSFDFDSDGTARPTLIETGRSAIEQLLSAHAGVAAAEEDTPIPPASPTIQATWTPDGRLTATYTPSPETSAEATERVRPTGTRSRVLLETDEPEIVPTLELSEYGQQLKFESGDIIKAFKIIGLKGKFPGPYGDYWYYTATDGAQEWTVAIFANHYNPDTGIGSSCTRGNCWNLPGKVVDVMYLSWIDDKYSMKEFYDPEGELHEGKPYIYASGLIVHK